MVYEPEAGLVTEVGPCAAGQAPEGSLLRAVLPRVPRRDGWIAERHGCTRACLWPLDRGAAFFIIRPHAGRPYDRGSPLRACGRLEPGPVAAQRGRGVEAPGEAQGLRRRRSQCDAAPRAGARRRYSVTHVPSRQGATKRVARL